MEQDERLEWHTRFDGDQGQMGLYFGGALGEELVFTYLSLCVVRPGEEDQPMSLESVFEIDRESSGLCAARSHSRQVYIEADDHGIPTGVVWSGRFRQAGVFQVYIVVSDHEAGVNVDWLVASGAFRADTCRYVAKFVSKPFLVTKPGGGRRRGGCFVEE